MFLNGTDTNWTQTRTRAIRKMVGGVKKKIIRVKRSSGRATAVECCCWFGIELNKALLCIRQWSRNRYKEKVLLDMLSIPSALSLLLHHLPPSTAVNGWPTSKNGSCVCLLYSNSVKRFRSIKMIGGWERKKKKKDLSPPWLLDLPPMVEFSYYRTLTIDKYERGDDTNMLNVFEQNAKKDIRVANLSSKNDFASQQRVKTNRIVNTENMLLPNIDCIWCTICHSIKYCSPQCNPSVDRTTNTLEYKNTRISKWCWNWMTFLEGWVGDGRRRGCFYWLEWKPSSTRLAVRLLIHPRAAQTSPIALIVTLYFNSLNAAQSCINIEEYWHTHTHTHTHTQCYYTHSV